MHSAAPLSDLSNDRLASTVSRLAAIAGDRRPGIAELLRSVAERVPAMLARARDLDRLTAFPVDDIAALRDCGVLLAPLPLRYGGLGLGTEAEGAAGLFDLLRLIGGGNMAVGRIVEGHVNALQLICLYGNETQIARAAADAAHGHLFAIWNTETPPGVRLGADGMLTGRKDHGSAAGSATRPLITVDQSRLLLASLTPGQRVGIGKDGLHGMRATQSGWIDFSLYAPRATDWIGGPGDYLREPAFSAGAWRALAVLVGGIASLVDALRTQLRARGRDANPHQAARIAQALIAQETAYLWTRKAALVAESGQATHEDATSYVNLARRAVEAAAFDAIQLAQRSLGLAALVDTNPVELLMRDLATYLRQPALDEAVMEAAAHFTMHALPEVA
jgi:alkylation response protein AidB-like acyl-CoA dehydrogenase